MGLPCAVFTLYFSGFPVASATSDIGGRFSFSGLRPGIYELVETMPPPGYQASTRHFLVIVTAAGNVTINGQPANSFVIDNVPLFDFAFLKLDIETGLPLSDATFTLAQKGVVVATVVSGINGMVNFGLLSPGIYTLNETAAPPGYRLDAQDRTVVIGPAGEITIDGVGLSSFIVGNVPSGFTILKLDTADNSPLEGAIFTLFQNGAPVLSSTTSPSGLALFSRLVPGNYTLVETAPPTGYLPNLTQYTVIVDTQGVVAIDGIPVPESGFPVENTAEPLLFTALLTKLEVDVSGNITNERVPGAEFTLYRFEGDSQIEIGQFTTSATGEITVSNLTAGDYLFVETYPGDLWTSYNGITNYPFTVNEDAAQDGVVSVFAFNQRLTGSLTITNTVQNSDGSSLTQEQLNMIFAFTVDFSEPGIFAYSIDGGPTMEIQSGSIIFLRHGQTAVIQELPFGTQYTVTPQPLSDYMTTGNNQTGLILGNVIASFTHIYNVLTLRN